MNELKWVVISSNGHDEFMEVIKNKKEALYELRKQYENLSKYAIKRGENVYIGLANIDVNTNDYATLENGESDFELREIINYSDIKYRVSVIETKSDGLEWINTGDFLEEFEGNYEEAKEKYDEFISEYEDKAVEDDSNYYISINDIIDDFDSRNDDKIVGNKNI